MALVAGQRSFRGLVMGRDTDIRILEESGVESRSVRRGDEPFPRAHGSIPGEHRYEESLIGLTLGVSGLPADIEDTVQAIRRAFQASVTMQFEYRMRNAGQDERLVYARAYGYGRPRTPTAGAGWVEIPVALVAVDPFIYSAELHSSEVPLFGTESGGVDFAWDFAVDWTEPTSTKLVVFNAGIENTYPTFQVERLSAADDFTGVELVNETTGVTYTQNSALTDGQRLVAVFGDPVTDIEVDGAGRYTEWADPREPFFLAAGFNTLRFEVLGTTPTTDVVARLSWRDAY